MSNHDPASPEGVDRDPVSADANAAPSEPSGSEGAESGSGSDSGPDSGFGSGAGAAQGATPPPPPTEASSVANDADESAEGVDPSTISVEDLVLDLERVSTERDEYLDGLRRLQAEFENYRKAVTKREADAKARANNGLVSELLPVLDACDGAVVNGADDVAPIRGALVEALIKQGLERIDPVDAPFDPEQHEAVMHEPGEGDGGPVVAEVLRVGYGWKGNVVRPAMVRVVG